MLKGIILTLALGLFGTIWMAALLISFPFVVAFLLMIRFSPFFPRFFPAAMGEHGKSLAYRAISICTNKHG